MQVDITVNNEPINVSAQVANRAGGIEQVLHDETLIGNGNDTPLSVNTEIIATKDELNTKQDKGDYATNTRVNQVEASIPEAYDDTEIRTLIDEVEEVSENAKAIAEGKATGYVFDTVDDMNTWLETNSSILKLGDNLYIRAVDVPDYWWDGETIQQLETQKVDLTDYVKNTDYAGNTGGVIKSSLAYSTKINDGFLTSVSETLDNYNVRPNTSFISKGTLNNVLTQYSKTVSITQTDYDALETKDANTLYLIEEE